MNISPDKSVGGFGPRTAPRRLTRHHVGRVRVRLAEMLATHGYTVAPEDLQPQTGAWRTDNRLDVCRWEATLTDGTGRTWLVQCWDTMSACVRYGVTVAPDERNPTVYLDVTANRPVPSSSVRAASSPGAVATNARGIRRTSAGKANR